MSSRREILLDQLKALAHRATGADQEALQEAIRLLTSNIGATERTHERVRRSRRKRVLGATEEFPFEEEADDGVPFP